MKEQKLEEAVDFLDSIVDEADNLIYLLQEIEVKLEKLDRKSRQIKEEGQNARSLLRTML
jgi:prefoldin subunit 5